MIKYKFTDDLNAWYLNEQDGEWSEYLVAREGDIGVYKGHASIGKNYSRQFARAIFLEMEDGTRINAPIEVVVECS